MSQSPSTPDFVRALDEALLANEHGEVRFGAESEALRLSQVEALSALRGCLVEGITIGHVVQPGGTGKTREGIVAAHAMHRNDGNTLFVVPSQQAVKDFSEKARTLCPDLDVGTVYQAEKRIGRLTFITYASLLRCILGESGEEEAHAFEEQQDDPGSARSSPTVDGRNGTAIDPAAYGLVLWDEAHKYLTVNAQKLLQRFKDSINIGLTATPRYYEGKEVAHVFGRKIHELDLATAVERKEISDFRNLLITTDVMTGLALSSPDQEESAEVAQAIDIPDRNKIFPDFYRNATIDVHEKKFVLAGEPAIVFGASIQHVHDLAKAFNDMLTPLLKSDEEFRSLLRAKGIDPDAVEQVAAPIHSGGSGEHEPMSLDERNALVERYDRRKVLVLTATSVLQQSFDSPATSVVIDTVPRQTYVGVGQAGMRALRWLANKEMAFIINTEDADHPSLTFLDFQAVRGAEEGVSVEIAGKKGTGIPRPARKHGSPSGYRMTYGSSLVDLAERRRVQANQIYRQDFGTSFRHFTTFGFQRLNQYILEMASGDRQAVNAFIELIRPWMDKNQERIASQIFEEQHIDGQVLADLTTDTLLQLIEKVQSGRVQGWARFATLFQTELRHRCKRLQKKYAKDEGMKTVRLTKNIPAPDAEKSELLHARLLGMHETIDHLLQTLTYREREVLKLRLGLNDGYIHTNEEVSKIFQVTRSRVGQIEAKAYRKLQHPVRSGQLEEFAEPERPLAILKRQLLEEQMEKNERILAQITPDLLAQKQIIFDILKCSDGSVDTQLIYQKTGVSSAHTRTITDMKFTNADDMFDALGDRVLTVLVERFPLIGKSFADAAAFDRAISELKRIMVRFTQMGGIIRPWDLKEFRYEPRY